MTRYEPEAPPECTRFHGALIAALRLTPMWSEGWNSAKLRDAMDKMFHRHEYNPVIYPHDFDPCEENVFLLGCRLYVLSYDQYGWCRVRCSENAARDALDFWCQPDWSPDAFLQIARELGEMK